ncbi:hypothetical protein QJS10_CPA05g00709 [Acorus calamus]|uniref:Prohibitin n=1 Tax=Acorus calamus TaxID=4465 RepID=A0AAV9ER37_ACOCL|nr:hypothetical protein QJS10_CPA05g00709 [Acorus calamus]
MPNVTASGGLSALVKAVAAGTVLIYMASNSLYNVEGGHRAIVFNCIGGIKDEVPLSSARSSASARPSSPST